MPQIRREMRKLGLYIDSISIPAQQGIDGEAVSKIVNSRGTTIGFIDSNFSKKTLDSCRETRPV